MVSMKGKIILVTGATDGIGKETAQELAKMGAHVIIHGRNSERAQKTKEEIRKATGNEELDIVVADYCSLKQVKTMADEIIAKYPRLDILLNNAGVYQKDRLITEDGFEQSFQVNHLAVFLLTNLLLNLLKKSAPSRIVTVASTNHLGSGLDFNDLQLKNDFDGEKAYRLSKLGCIYMSYELAEQLKGTGVTSNSLHPGVVDTKMLRFAHKDLQGISLAQGACTSVYLATSPEVKRVTGKFFNQCQEVRSKEITYDTVTRKKFWEISEKLLAKYLN
jgi:NAD(P)-dependent dehydrogenase (short-subunit alcohol dehydrogenase family)